MKRIIIFILLLFIAFGIFSFLKQEKSATIDRHEFFVDIAVSQKDQEIGLAKYNSLSQDKGMYFIFPRPGFYAFWMKNMHFPIDIIFIRNSKIVTIFSNVPSPQKGQTILPTYSPSYPSDAVLEINAGLAQKYGFKKGDTVQLVQ